MRERPILFSAEMVRAILEGRKSQTRRVINPRTYIEERFGEEPDSEVERVIYQSEPEFGAAAMRWLRCPYGQPGDRLWVREAFSFSSALPISLRRPGTSRRHVWYWADDNPEHGDWTQPKPSIHMPRWASRITLEVTGVRVERLCGMRESDAIAEGCPGQVEEHEDDWPTEPIEQFATLWDSLNEKRGYGWDANPWVWVIEFKRVEA